MIELLTTYNIVIGVSIVLNVVLLIGVRNLLRQNEQLEDRLIKTIDETRVRLIKTIDETRDAVSKSLEQMRQLDNREVFEKDDEVGVTFNELKKVVEDLNNEL